VECIEHSRLACPTEALAYAPVMDHKISHGLHPLCHHRTRPGVGGGGLIHYLTHEKYESLNQREFGHTHVYDVNLLKMVGMDEQLPLILRTIGWGKLYGGDRMSQATDG
jgi:hypothetical protein